MKKELTVEELAIIARYRNNASQFHEVLDQLDTIPTAKIPIDPIVREKKHEVITQKLNESFDTSRVQNILDADERITSKKFTTHSAAFAQSYLRSLMKKGNGGENY